MKLWENNIENGGGSYFNFPFQKKAVNKICQPGKCPKSVIQQHNYVQLKDIDYQWEDAQKYFFCVTFHWLGRGGAKPFKNLEVLGLGKNCYKWVSKIYEI